MRQMLADANIGLRILVGQSDIQNAVNDKERMHNATREIVQKVYNGEIELLFEDAVVEEMVFVLTKFYRLPRSQVAEGVLVLLQSQNIVSSKIIKETLELYKQIDLDIVDIKLGVISKAQGIPILSWDKGFTKLANEYYSPSDLINDHNEA